MDDTFWQEIDAALELSNGTIQQAPMVSPFATVEAVEAVQDVQDTDLIAFNDVAIPDVTAQTPNASLPIFDLLDFSTPVPGAPIPSTNPNPNPNVTENTDSVVNRTLLHAHAHRADSMEIDSLRNGLRMLLDQVGGSISFAKFKREANRAWKRKFPDYKPYVNPFQAFVKDNIKVVRDNAPTQGHGDHMKTLGRMWRDAKRKREH